MKSILSLNASCHTAGIPVSVSTHEFSDIVISRNALMSRFLAAPKVSHCLWLDSDMIFTPDLIFRMADFGEDWVVGTYPQKQMPWKKLRRMFEAEADLPADQKTPTETILKRAWRYNHQPGAFQGETYKTQRRGDFVTVQGCGAGLMLMTRAVPEKMVEGGQARAMSRMTKTEDGKPVPSFDFFSHIVSPDGGYLYAEDQSVCLRWIRLGQQIWMDTSAVVGHVGTHTWIGQYKDALDAGE